MKELYLYKSVYHYINVSTMHFTAEFKAIITGDGEVDLFFSFPLTFISRLARQPLQRHEWLFGRASGQLRWLPVHVAAACLLCV